MTPTAKLYASTGKTNYSRPATDILSWANNEHLCIVIGNSPGRQNDAM